MNERIDDIYESSLMSEEILERRLSVVHENASLQEGHVLRLDAEADPAKREEALTRALIAQRRLVEVLLETPDSIVKKVIPNDRAEKGQIGQ